MVPKYRIPEVYGVVERKRLYSIFERHAKAGLFLLTGQAAQGKSTLAAAFLRQKDEPVIWVHLTRTESDPEKLFEKLAHGFDYIFKDSDAVLKNKAPQATLGAGQDLFRYLEILVTFFDAVNMRLTIVLDDLESIDEDSQGFLLISELIRQHHPGICFFILCRTLPCIGGQPL